MEAARTTKAVATAKMTFKADSRAGRRLRDPFSATSSSFCRTLFIVSVF
jgi:hypothetical protein